LGEVDLTGVDGILMITWWR